MEFLFEDQAFLESADPILLARNSIESELRSFGQAGIDDIESGKYVSIAVIIGFSASHSAGAVEAAISYIMGPFVKK